jgi:hypothetical protein
MSVANNVIILNTESKLNNYARYVKHGIEYVEEMTSATGFIPENAYDYNLEAALVARCRSEGCLKMDTDITEDF